MRLDKENQGIRPPGRERSAVESRRLGGPAGEIMLAARTLFERRGVGKTTVKDIAAEANVTRELVYYYFENKQAVIDAVIDDYVEDLVESVLVWNESRVFGDTAGSLRSCIAAFRRALYDANGLRPMIRVLEELGVRDAFDVRAVRETVDCLSGRVLVEYAEYHQVEIEFVYERGDLRAGRPREDRPRHQRRGSHEGGGADAAPRHGAACAGCLGQAAGQRIGLGTSPVLLDDAKIVYSSATTFSAWRSRDRYPVVL